MKSLTNKLFLGIALVPLFFSANLGALEDTDTKQAIAVAEAIDAMVRSTRSMYTRTVVTKLKKDGKGAKQRSEILRGFVPLPAQFVRNVALHLENSPASEKFKIELRSNWNLNPEQGLQDNFEMAGWKYLMRQQDAAGGNLQGIKWDPYIKVEYQGEKQVLRYFSADTAVAQACAGCHNSWENRASVKKLRGEANMEPGKTFRLNELIGAVSISVALN
ncbi:MAG: DUF3365 domain-containing protein [Gammaproteobacteria bacterium]|nr:DUF3365 domain-containing protein [Gammaproteobacteria bacterium]